MQRCPQHNRGNDQPDQAARGKKRDPPHTGGARDTKKPKSTAKPKPRAGCGRVQADEFDDGLNDMLGMANIAILVPGVSTGMMACAVCSLLS